MRGGGCAAGSSRTMRLDPFALPLRFVAHDAAADGRVRQVELHRKRVVVRRSLGGMRMAINLPVSAFAGVGLQVTVRDGGAQAFIVLAHKDPGLCIRRSRRCLRRMAKLGQRARSAAPHRGQRQVARSTRPHGWRARRCAEPASPAPQFAEAPSSFDSDVPRRWQADGQCTRPPRRARDHRAELKQSCLRLNDPFVYALP